MKMTPNQFADEVISKAKRARVRRRVIAMLSVVVLLFTMNRSISPADALETDAEYGKEIGLYVGEEADAAQLPTEDAAEGALLQPEEGEEDAQPEMTTEQLEATVGEETLTLGEDVLPEDAQDAGDAAAAAETEYACVIGERTSVGFDTILREAGLAIGGDAEIAQVVDADHPADLIRVTAEDGGAVVHVVRSFDSVELAVLTEADIHIIKLLDARVAEDPEAVVASTEETGEVFEEVPVEASGEDSEEEGTVETGEAVVSETEEERIEEAEVETEPEFIGETEAETPGETGEAREESEAEDAGEVGVDEAASEEAGDEAEEHVGAAETQDEAGQEENGDEAEAEDEAEEAEKEAEEPSKDESGKEESEDESEEEENEEASEEESEEEENEEASEEESEEPSEEEAPGEQPEEEREESAFTRFEARIDVSEMTAPFSLRAMLDVAREAEPATEETEVGEAAPDEAEMEEPEADEAEEASSEEAAAEEAFDETKDDIEAWTVRCDEALLSVERAGDDYEVTPLDSFESTEIAVTTPDAGYVLTLENAALTEPEAQGAQEAPALYVATYDLTQVELPLSLPAMMAEARPGEAEVDAEDAEWIVEYDESLIEIDADYGVMPVAAFDETEIAVDAGAARYAFTLLNYAEASVRTELDLGLAVVTPVDEALGFDENAAGFAGLLSDVEAEAARAAVERIQGIDEADTLDEVEATPGETVEGLSVELSEDAEGAEEKSAGTITVEHRTEYQAFNICLENVDAGAYEDGFNVTVTLPEAVSAGEPQLYRVQPDAAGEAAVEPVAVEVLEGDGEVVNAFAFTADSLDGEDAYVLSYTVDFYYGEFEYHMDGGNSLRLSRLFEALGVDEDAAEAEEVSFSSPELVQVARADADWLLISLRPFQTEETLQIAMANGNRYTVVVRDAQNIGKISKLEVSARDGVAPFDGNNDPGNDADNQNNRVRAYDTVTYTLTASVQPHDETQSYENGRVGYRVAIPNDDELNLDHGAMGWAENWSETVEGDKRVYTFFRTIPQNNGVAIPGSCAAEVIVNVGGKLEGYKFTPEIDVWSEGNEAGKQSPNIDEIYVTTRPAYNVVLDKGTMSGLETKVINGNEYTGYEAAFGVAVEMRNTNMDKALRGLELVDTSKDITFEIELSTSVRENGVDRVINDPKFTPLLVDFKKNGQDNDYIAGLPGGGPGIGSNDQTRVCGRTGDVEVVQNGNKLTVTVKGGTYNCDPSEFPETSLNGHSYMNGDKFLEGIFSSYYFTVLMPKEVDGQSMTDYTQFSLFMDAQVTSMRVTSVTGEVVTQQSNPNDDHETVSRWFTGTGGTHDQEIFFSEKNNWTEPYTKDAKWDGSDYAVIGAQSAYTALFRGGYGTQDVLDRVIAFDQLVKFDDKAISVDPEKVARDDQGRLDHENTEGNWHCKVLYAYKPDGSGWSSEEELIRTKEEALYYSETYLSDRTCVGKLYQWRGINPIESSEFSKLSQSYIVIKTDEGVANNAYTLTSTCNGWTARGFIDKVAAYKNLTTEQLQALIDSSDTAKDAQYYFRDYAQNNWNLTDGIAADVNVDRDSEDGGYRKAQYDETGYLGRDTAGDQCGDTIYIVPYVSRISKKVAQRYNGEPKSNYSLDTNQRVADYVLQSSLSFDYEVDLSQSDWETDVTLTDTLPNGLTYIGGSSFLGGTYSEPENNPCMAPGTVSDGERLVPEVTQNADGTTQLVWKFRTKVVNGRLPDVHYSCTIGNADDPDRDLANGTSLTNTASIITSDDHRRITKENANLTEATIQVSKLNSFSIHKRVSEAIEADGTGTFTISVNNTSAMEEINVLGVDVMPRDGYGNTVLKGAYQLTDGMTIDKNRIGDLSDVEIWFTDNEIDQDTANAMTIDQIRVSGSGWYQGTVNAETGAVTGDYVGKWPRAIAYYDHSLAPQKSARITMGFKAQNGRTDDIMFNTFGVGSKMLYMTQTTKVYTRTISGKAWIDLARDGIFDADSDTLYKNVTATLYNRDGSVKATTTTDDDGYYCFGLIENNDPSTVILHGEEEYYIVFTQPEGSFHYDNLEPVADGVDEFGNAGEAEKALATVLGRIDGIKMPSIPDMRDHGIVHYDLPDQNIAYHFGYALPSTGGTGTTAYSVGGILLVLGAALLLLLKSRRHDL